MKCKGVLQKCKGGNRSVRTQKYMGRFGDVRVEHRKYGWLKVGAILG